MNTSAQLTKLTGLRRTPGLAEMEGMMELLPNASLLVEVRNGRILLANSAAVELTAYTRNELAGLTFGALVDKLDEKQLWSNPSPLGMALRRRNGSRVEVQAKRIDMAPQSKWCLISIEEMQTIQMRQAMQQRRAQMQKSMQAISLALGQVELDAAVAAMLEAGREITGADVLSVYLQELEVETQDMEIIRFAQCGANLELPESLPSGDLVHLRSAHVWTQAKRSSTSLHRAARALGLSYIASAPLGQSQAVIGFIAAAGSQPQPAENLLPQLQTLADTLTAIIQFHTRLSNLESSLQVQQRARVLDKATSDALEDGILVLTPTLRVVRLNPAAEQILGYTSQEARGHPVDDILIGSGALSSSLQLALQGLPTLHQDDFRLFRRSGQPFLAQISIVPALSQEHVEGVIVLLRDISEQEQIQAQAKQLEQSALLGEVTAVFAHEVRNPINNLSTGLEYMAYNLAPDDPHQEVITRLQQDCDRLNEMMKPVLTFPRPVDQKLEPVDLSALVHRLLERIKPRMVRANIQQFVQIEPSLPPVNGNSLALEQVFVNLITNGVQAMTDKGGTLAVRAQPITAAGGKRYVEVNVADNGPGIPKELQEKLFQPFFTTKADGTGLGLAITKRIISAHKGNITVTSYPGATVFHVQIPVLESV
jgi:PAS domain S-box-containing protein